MADQPVIAPASAQDFLAYSGQLPPYRVMAWSAKVGDRVIGLGGVVLLPNSLPLAFLDVGDEARRYPKTLHKTGRAFIAWLRAKGLRTVVATTFTQVERADEWLIRLGFKPVQHGDVTVFLLED